MVDAYEQALTAAEDELEALLTEESEIQSRLVEVKSRKETIEHTVESLNALLGKTESSDSIGLTDAIRQVMGTKVNTPMLPTNIRADLRNIEFAIDDYSNPLAVIHSTLKRLEKQEEVFTHISQRDGKTRYYCKRDISEDADIPF